MDSGQLNARQFKILEYINANGSAQIKELNGLYDVSEATIRRDFDELARIGLIERVHGGAVRGGSTSYERVHSEKMTLMLAEKMRIAAKAASLIENGESIFLDSGTTTYFIARELVHHKDLTIITNNLDIAQTVQFDPTVTVVVTGGIRREQYSVLYGSLTEQTIRNFCVDKAFMGCDAIDPEQGVFNTNIMEIGVKRCIARCGKETILVTDSSKFSVKALARVCGLSEIDVIITDTGLDEGTVKQLKEQIPNIICT